MRINRSKNIGKKPLLRTVGSNEADCSTMSTRNVYYSLWIEGGDLIKIKEIANSSYFLLDRVNAVKEQKY